jgi:membrane-bound serine protease (ClpP class)
MFPSGQIEINGQRYEAGVAVGMINSGQKIIVRGKREFGLLVETMEEETNG